VCKLELELEPPTDVQNVHNQQTQQIQPGELSLSVDANKPFDMNIAESAEKKDFSLSHTQSPSVGAEHDEKEESQPMTMTMPLPSVPSDGSVPLAVPMMANTMHSSVTRNDAKMITETRLKRLRHLSQTSEEVLSKPQKDEKKRIIRLEKNRRAAAMSRRKKKIYVKNLEENSKLMARHIAILEMENNHLRAMMSVSQPGTPMRFPPTMHPMHRVPYMAPPSASSTAFNTGSVPSMPSSTTSLEPPMKRRKIESSTASTSDVCSEIDAANESQGGAHSLEPDQDAMEPLPLPIPVNGPPAPPSMPGMNVGPLIPRHIHMANMRMHPQRMMPYPMHHGVGMNGLNPMMMHQNGMAVAPPPSLSNNNAAPQRVFAPEIGKLDVTVTDVKEQSNYKDSGAMDDERKSVETDDGYGGGYLDNMAPPDVMNLSILDDHDDIDVIDETVDECGSVIGFQGDTKSGQMVFL